MNLEFRIFNEVRNPGNGRALRNECFIKVSPRNRLHFFVRFGYGEAKLEHSTRATCKLIENVLCFDTC